MIADMYRIDRIRMQPLLYLAAYGLECYQNAVGLQTTSCRAAASALYSTIDENHGGNIGHLYGSAIENPVVVMKLVVWNAPSQSDCHRVG